MTRGTEAAGIKAYLGAILSALAIILQIIVIYNQYATDKTTHETEQDNRLLKIECRLSMGDCSDKK